MTFYNKLKELNPKIIYYLLDWKDTHPVEFLVVTGKEKMHDLTKEELIDLFKYVTGYDMTMLRKDIE